MYFGGRAISYAWRYTSGQGAVGNFRRTHGQQLPVAFLCVHRCTCCITSLSLVLEAFWLTSNIFFSSTEFLIQCDGCWEWGWVWQARLVAGLWLGQAFGMFLLPGFGVGSSSPQVSRHPTSMCDAGVNFVYIVKHLTESL